MYWSGNGWCVNGFTFSNGFCVKPGYVSCGGGREAPASEGCYSNVPGTGPTCEFGRGRCRAGQLCSPNGSTCYDPKYDIACPNGTICPKHPNVVCTPNGCGVFETRIAPVTVELPLPVGTTRPTGSSQRNPPPQQANPADRCITYEAPRKAGRVLEDNRWQDTYLTDVKPSRQPGCPADVNFIYTEPDGKVSGPWSAPFRVQTTGGPPRNIRVVR